MNMWHSIKIYIEALWLLNWEEAVISHGYHSDMYQQVAQTSASGVDHSPLTERYCLHLVNPHHFTCGCRFPMDWVYMLNKLRAFLNNRVHSPRNVMKRLESVNSSCLTFLSARMLYVMHIPGSCYAEIKLKSTARFGYHSKMNSINNLTMISSAA